MCSLASALGLDIAGPLAMEDGELSRLDANVQCQVQGIRHPILITRAFIPRVTKVLSSYATQYVTTRNAMVHYRVGTILVTVLDGPWSCQEIQDPLAYSVRLPVWFK